MSGGFLISGRTHLHSGGPRPGAERVGRDLQLDADWGSHHDLSGAPDLGAPLTLPFRRQLSPILGGVRGHPT